MKPWIMFSRVWRWLSARSSFNRQSAIGAKDGAKGERLREAVGPKCLSRK
jgi:hypothetical protein